MLKQILPIIVLLIGSLFSSCDKNNEELQPSYDLNGTVWIHQFKPGEHKSYAARALVFGRNTANFVSLDSTLKVIDYVDTYAYKVDGKIIMIGSHECPFTDYSFYWVERYYRSDLKPSDILIR